MTIEARIAYFVNTAKVSASISRIMAENAVCITVHDTDN